ncbi:hypothetical protein V1264_008732 [Littorina saxatilis]|uniref:Transposon Tf2-9 poly n=1 Tax=Littorina saxatilis TaxID=31220 RepID=A0AAN9AU97_9CAEN
MKIAQAEKKHWQDEVLKYIAAYRATPHPSTGRSPAELLFNRQIHTKLPQLKLFTECDQDVRDQDAEKKGLSKMYADDKRNAKASNAKASNVNLGDTVLLHQEVTGKFDTPFHPEPCEVIEKAGSKVTVQTPSGAVYSSTSSFVKKYQERDDDKTLGEEEKPSDKTLGEEEKPPDKTLGEEEKPPDKIPTKPTRIRAAPKKLEDYVVKLK